MDVSVFVGWDVSGSHGQGRIRAEADHNYLTDNLSFILCDRLPSFPRASTFAPSAAFAVSKYLACLYNMGDTCECEQCSGRTLSVCEMRGRLSPPGGEKTHATLRRLT